MFIPGPPLRAWYGGGIATWFCTWTVNYTPTVNTQKPPPAANSDQAPLVNFMAYQKEPFSCEWHFKQDAKHSLAQDTLMVLLLGLNNVGTVHRSNKLEYHINPMDEPGY